MKRLGHSDFASGEIIHIRKGTFLKLRVIFGVHWRVTRLDF